MRHSVLWKNANKENMQFVAIKTPKGASEVISYRGHARALARKTLCPDFAALKEDGNCDHAADDVAHVQQRGGGGGKCGSAVVMELGVNTQGGL